MAKQGVYADFPVPEEWWPSLEKLRPIRYRWRGRKLSSLGSLVDACLQLLPEDRRQMVWARLGPEKTLQEVGDTHGVTRERIRQVVNKVTRTFLKEPKVRLVLDNVFSALGNNGPLIVNVSEAQSSIFPEAMPDELWQFVMNIWCQIQKRPAQSVRLETGIFLFAPDGLPSERTVRAAMTSRASFLHPSQLAAALEIHPAEAEAVACAFPQLIRTQSGLYGYQGWTQPQLIKAIAEQLARDGFTEWHFSEIGKAAIVFDPSLKGQAARNFAAVLSRHDTAKFFEKAGRDGFWRLRSLGDGHQSNYAAIYSILEHSTTPLHWSEIQQQLQRNVNDGTITALLGRESAFVALGSGVFGIAERQYPDHQSEEDFMRMLFASSKRDYLTAQEVFEKAAQTDITPKQLMAIGRYSSTFRYWKWGDNDALFLTVTEANRRFFERWLSQRNHRNIPSNEVLIAGMQAAFERQDRSALRMAYETLQAHNHPLPPQAMHWIDWALG